MHVLVVQEQCFDNSEHAGEIDWTIATILELVPGQLEASWSWFLDNWKHPEEGAWTTPSGLDNVSGQLHACWRK